MREPPLSPPSKWAEIFRRTCLQSHLQTSPPTPQKSYPKFQKPRTNFESFKKKQKNLKTAPRGPGGGLRIFFGVNISFFVRINPLWSFRTLTDLLLKFSKKNLKKPKNRPPGGQGVGVRILFFFQNFYCFILGAHAKIWNPKTTSSVVLNSGGKKKRKEKKRENFRSRRWGSSLPVCARLTVCSSPHRVTFKHLPQHLRSHIWSFGTLGQLFEIHPLSAPF